MLVFDTITSVMSTKANANSETKGVKKVNHVLNAHRNAQAIHSISNIFNQCAKKNYASDNYYGMEYKKLIKAIKEDGDYKNDVDGLIFKNRKGFVVLTNHFCKEFWSKDRNTSKEGKTWNLYTNVVVNKGRCSTWFFYSLVRKLATMPTEDFNTLYNRGMKLKPLKNSGNIKTTEKDVVKV